MLKTMSQKEFSEEIEKYVRVTRESYMDSIIMYCKENDLDYESINSLLSTVLKQKIQYEAENLNMMAKTATQLPL
jgi:hypothetical protein